MSTVICSNRFCKYDMLDVFSYPDKPVYFPISEEEFNELVIAYRSLYDIEYCGTYQVFIDKETGSRMFRRWYK